MKKGLLLCIFMLVHFGVWSQCNFTISYTKTDYQCSGGGVQSGFPIPVYGSVTVSVANGAAPFQYKMNNGNFQNSNFFDNLNGDTYTLYVQDASNCIDSVSITIDQPAVPSISYINNTLATCVPGCDGTMSIQALGGTPPYQYAISYAQFPPQIQTSNLFASLCEGAYNVSVIDSNGCMATQQKTITTHTVAPIAVIYIEPTCLNSCDGQASVTSIPGAVYAIAPSGAINVATGFSTGLCAGITYTITATDGNGCTSSTSVQISNAAPINFVSATATPSCLNGANGSISVWATGGYGTLSYSISPFTQINTTGQFFNRSAQTYSITVSDAIGCSSSTIVTVPQVQSTPISISNITQASCIYECDGSALFSGIPGLVYTIAGPGTPTISSNGQAGSLCATGVYVVSAIDGYGCWSTASLTVGATTIVPSPTISYIQHSTCAPGNDGSIVIPDLLNNPFFYTYDIQPTLPSMTMSNDTIKGMPAGVYTITASDPISGCMGSKYVTINYGQYQPINVNTTTPSSCSSCTGSVTLSTGSITSLSINPSANIVSNSLINNLCANTQYTVVATDAYNCITSTTFYMTSQNINLTTTSITNPSCYPGFDGAITVSSNGQTPITYTLQGGQIQQSNTTGVFTGLSDNWYTITAIDANNCTQTISYTLSNVPQSLSVSSVTNTCSDLCQGSAQVAGPGIVSYTINGPGNPVINTNGTASNLCHNSYYYITGTSANGCTSSTTIFIGTLPAPNILIMNIKAPICGYPNSGSFVLFGYSNPNITYSLNPSVNFTVNNDTIQGLSAGNYTVTALSTNGCSKTQIVTIPTSSPMTLGGTTLALPSCFANCNGVVQFSSSNTLPSMNVYKFPTQFSNVRIDSVELAVGKFENLCEGWHYFRIEQNGCVSNTVSINLPFDQTAIPDVTITYPCTLQNNGEIKVVNPKLNTSYTLYNMPIGASQISQGHFINLIQGAYSLHCLDTLTNCLVVKQIYIENPFLQTITFSPTCSNSSNCSNILKLKPYGLNTPVTYSFSPSNNIFQLNDSTFTGFCKDSTYQITITDSLGCVSNRSHKIYNTPSNFSVQKTNAQCLNCDGSITANANSIYSPHTFLLQSSSANYTNLSGIFTGLCPDNYTLTVTDANGLCSEKIVTLYPFYTQKVISPDSCFGACKGKATINPIGVIGAYTMSITPSVGNLIGNTFSNLCAGTYTLHITDASPCSLDTVFTIYEPSPLDLALQTYSNSVCNLSNGQVQLYPQGGTPPYFLSSNAGIQNGWQVSQLYPGTYTFWVTDENQCKDSFVHTIVDTIPHFIDSLISTPVSCYQDDGSIWIAYKEGPPYFIEQFSLDKVNWSHLAYYDYIKSDTYTIYAKTVDGCIDSATTFVGFKNNLQVVDLSIETERCTGTDDGKIIFPSNDFIYSIEPYYPVDHHNRVIEDLPVGHYTLTATDARGCSGATLVSISAVSPLALQTNIIHSTYGDCHGEVQVSAQGGTPPYTFLAEPSNFVNISDSGTLHYLCNTQYEVMVRDKHGCEQRQQIFIPYQDLDGDDFAIYPNPAQQEVSFIFSRKVDVVITLSDISGRIVHNEVYVEKDKVTLPVSHLANGVYVATLNFDGQKFVRKLEVRH